MLIATIKMKFVPDLPDDIKNLLFLESLAVQKDPVRIKIMPDWLDINRNLWYLEKDRKEFDDKVFEEVKDMFSDARYYNSAHKKIILRATTPDEERFLEILI